MISRAESERPTGRGITGNTWAMSILVIALLTIAAYIGYGSWRKTQTSADVLRYVDAVDKRIRSMATALQSYRQATGQYPPDADSFIEFSPENAGLFAPLTDYDAGPVHICFDLLHDDRRVAFVWEPGCNLPGNNSKTETDYYGIEQRLVLLNDLELQSIPLQIQPCERYIVEPK